MTISTTNFGELAVAPDRIIRVEAGLLGLEELTDYVLVENTDTEGKVPFWWLQSCKDPDMALVVTIPFLFDPEYQVEISEDVVRILGIQEEKDVAVYSVCKIPETFEDMTVNLKSPIVVNTQNCKAMQIVMYNAQYSIDEPAVKKYKKFFSK